MGGGDEESGHSSYELDSVSQTETSGSEAGSPPRRRPSAGNIPVADDASRAGGLRLLPCRGCWTLRVASVLVLVLFVAAALASRWYLGSAGSIVGDPAQI